MDTASLITGCLSCLLHSLDLLRGLKNAYGDARVLKENVDYLEMELGLYGSLVQQFEQIKADQDSLDPTLGPEELEKAKINLKNAADSLTEHTPLINDVERRIREARDSSIWDSTMAGMRRGGGGMMNYLMGREGDLEKIQRLFKESFRDLIGIAVVLNSGQLSVINHGMRGLLEEAGDSAKILEEVGSRLKALAGIVQMLEKIEETLDDLYGKVSQKVTLIQPADASIGFRWTRERLKERHRNMEIDAGYVKYIEASTDLGAVRIPAIFSSKSHKVQGFVEWRYWDETGQELGSKTQVGYQVGSLAQVLGTKERPPKSAKVPQCHGFFLENDRERYGMFFSFREFYETQYDPQGDLPIPAEPQSLQWLLDQQTQEPDRDWKLRTSHELMSALHSLHSLEVYHKAFSSKNVLFLGDKVLSDSPPISVGEGPYLAGLFQARMAAMYSDHTNGGGTDLIYLPWKYIDDREDRQGPSDLPYYHPKYDLFGLGLVCAEIALWKPMKEQISNLVQWEPGNPRMARRVLDQNWVALEEKIVEECEKAMGITFSKAVAWCLTEGAAGGSREDERKHLDGLKGQIRKIEMKGLV